MTQAEDRKTPHQDDSELVRGQESGWALPTSLETARLARWYFDAARVENNASAYDFDIRDFATWCKVEAGGLSALPASPETVALYITDLAAGRGLKASTIRRRFSRHLGFERWAPVLAGMREQEFSQGKMALETGPSYNTVKKYLRRIEAEAGTV